MKIYFAGSIRGGRDFSHIYPLIINRLKKYGEVLTEHVANDDYLLLEESHLTDYEIHERDIDWLMNSDIVIAEVSNPSLGVGYELGRAIENNKRIFCLFMNTNSKKISAMISGMKKIEIVYYKETDDINSLIDNIFLNLYK